MTPTRIVFEGPMRTAEVFLLNRSDRVRSYAMEFVQCRMDEKGELKELDKAAKPEADERFGDSYLRFTPRRVILEPHQSQVVRLQLRKPLDLAEGEYRSHLKFRLIPTAEDAAKPDSVKKGVRIKLIPLYGVTIPVIVRHGKLQATSSITGLHLDAKGGQGKANLAITIERKGSCSTIGNLEALWKTAGKRDVSVGMIKGLAVYTPNARRTIVMPLAVPKGSDLRGGQLIVRYIEHGEESERLLAEGRLAVP